MDAPMSRRFLGAMIGLMAFSASLVAQADQAAWIAKKDADAGAALIGVGHEIRDYCAPCHDTGYKARNVTSVDVGQPNAGFWEVRVNGRGVDLAYEYVLINGHWKNVAMAIGMNVVMVPAELPSTVPAK